MLFNWYRRRFYRCHDFNKWSWSGNYDVSCECLGVTLSWGLNPVRYFRWTMTCLTCGATSQSEGYLSCDDDIDAKRDDDGWPLDENGQRLPIYEHRRVK